ncbi:hypothetical protein DSO57_1016042 [Entomophthora muscae]|uniref:Uncharacterized protein n=1 Tax=Entomophthora muscae TaxID=34485 RepID=A0ACC2UDV5_9FUNG|nr:hypothetical protein DSO57_1016042 [Entomophthora muscae]
MSPLLFNFAANILLTACQVRLKGRAHPGQDPLKASAFADNTVCGIADQEDVLSFTELLDLYQRGSNAKVNVDKTVTVRIGLPDFQPPVGMKSIDPHISFRHLGIMFTSNDIAQAAMEQKLLSDLVDCIGKWRYKRLDLASKAQALNKIVGKIVPGKHGGAWSKPSTSKSSELSK